MFADLSHYLASNTPGFFSGVAAADFDGDGRPEFFVAGVHGPNRLLKWVAGQLHDVAPPVLADPHHSATGCVAGDIDGDGIDELCIAVEGGRVRIFDRGVDGVWQHIADVAGSPGDAALAVLDRRGIGRYGVFVAPAEGAPSLYEFGAEGRFADRAASLGLTHTCGGGMVAAPLFATGTDLFCANGRGPNRLYRNTGTGAFEEAAAGLGLTDSNEHTGVATVVDAGDDRLGLVWGNADGPNRLMLRRADGKWRDRATPGFAFPSAVRSIVAADFDNDGQIEVFFHNHGEPNRLFRLSTDEDDEPAYPLLIDPGAAADAAGFGTGAAVADIDGDGVLELLLLHAGPEAEPLGLYKARMPAGQSALRIQPLTRFGAPARGAMIRADIDGRERIQVVDGGSGTCQMEPTAHFGFAAHASIGRVTVTWPDGASSVLRNPTSTGIVIVPYPGG